MEDKFLDGMINTSLEYMKKLAEGETLSSDELKFILLARQMSAQAAKAKAPSTVEKIVNSAKPILSLVSPLIGL